MSTWDTDSSVSLDVTSSWGGWREGWVTSAVLLDVRSTVEMPTLWDG